LILYNIINTTNENLELVKKAFMICNKNKNIKFKHIRAHTELKDEHSTGNDGADKLANLAIGYESCMYNITKIYLNVPYKKKEEGKSLGAKWDLYKKKMYIENNLDEEKKNKLYNLFGSGPDKV